MKKSLSVILVILVVALLATGCSEKQEPAQNTGNDPVSSQGNTPTTPGPSTPAPSENPPAGQGSVNPDDYWVSDTEFDMIAFCAAHGLDTNKVVEPEMGEPILRLLYNEQLNGKTIMSTRIELGDGYFITAVRNDYADLQSTRFVANSTEDWQADQKVTFTGTNVFVYPNRMDFILYVIPRLLDGSVEDPMQGFGYTHNIFSADIQVVDDGNYRITYGDDTVTVYD